MLLLFVLFFQAVIKDLTEAGSLIVWQGVVEAKKKELRKWNIKVYNLEVQLLRNISCV